ncbi:hypothetical protein FD13_GL000945 [Levilactobacillus senmaizukei DSM 21775 = NBRC 103853]|uniref:Uncharacterized protein n=1 Tax=Levilactobacillus senmaizukei DSM 21775 = NBRC 103853 TaxID=1423803 RepID=A0A0R2DHR1_9LACO|nr:hypothetical protein FD13_GL000945 [Levilactobacillus senmaizukei DSM 21775 = NBRC 103853]
MAVLFGSLSTGVDKRGRILNSLLLRELSIENGLFIYQNDQSRIGKFFCRDL